MYFNCLFYKDNPFEYNLKLLYTFKFNFPEHRFQIGILNTISVPE